jgi:glycosyltransferase involved in cell wall biosynthesis
MPFARSVVTMHGLHPLHRPGGHSYRLAGRALVGAVAAAADATICVSHADAAMLATLRPRPRGVTVVRNGIDPPAAIGADERAQARATLDLGDDVLAVLVLARLTEAKDMPTTLAAARALEDDGVVVLVAGRGELENEVRAGAGPSVRLLGHRTDVRQLLAASDVLLTTSLWEGMPLAVLEAMGAGRAVVASAAAGNAEAVGDAGLLVAIGDAAGFAAAIRSLRDPTRRAALGDAARERVLANFAIADQLAATAAVYSIVLDRPVW